MMGETGTKVKQLEHSGDMIAVRVGEGAKVALAAFEDRMYAAH